MIEIGTHAADTGGPATDVAGCVTCTGSGLPGPDSRGRFNRTELPGGFISWETGPIRSLYMILPGASGTGSAVGSAPSGRAQFLLASHRLGVVQGGGPLSLSLQ